MHAPAGALHALFHPDYSVPSAWIGDFSGSEPEDSLHTLLLFRGSSVPQERFDR